MILLVGASASGKTEVAKDLYRLFGIKKAVTHTSRPPRPGEKDGVDYHFVDKETFLKLDSEGKMVENTFYNGNHYGCSKAELADDKCVILDPNGLKTFQALNDPRLVSFYLEASEETRRVRMLGRGDPLPSVEKRLETDRVAFSDEKVGSTDFRIKTEGKTVEEIAKEVHDLYIKTLKKRG